MSPVPMACLPWAGAGAGVYRTWREQRSPRLRAHPIQVPGREDEFTGAFYRDMPEAAAATAGRIRAAVDAGPYIVFGHSFGAVLAFESVRHLASAGAPLPDLLVVSGSASPRRRRSPPLAADDDQLVAELGRTTGEINEALLHPELRPLLLPALRADLGLLHDYTTTAEPALPVPITALRGIDDPMVAADGLGDWAAFTTADFRTVEFRGGHMYLTSAWDQLWNVIEEQL